MMRSVRPSCCTLISASLLSSPNPKMSRGRRHMPSLHLLCLLYLISDKKRDRKQDPKLTWKFWPKVCSTLKFLITDFFFVLQGLSWVTWYKTMYLWWHSGSLDVWELFSGHTAVMIIYLYYLIQEFMYLDKLFHCVEIPFSTTERTMAATAPSTAGKPKVKWTPEVSWSLKARLKHLWKEEKV